MSSVKRYRGLIVASFALAAVMAVFVYEGFALYAKTVAYARSDLQARAELAALVLEEPLRTQDFKAIGEFDADCRAKEIELTIYHRDGVFFGKFQQFFDALCRFCFCELFFCEFHNNLLLKKII